MAGKGRSKKEKEESEEPKEPQKPKKVKQRPVPKVKKSVPTIGIDRYLTRKEIPKRHHAAMRSFTDVRVATWEQWEDIFKGY